MTFLIATTAVVSLSFICAIIGHYFDWELAHFSTNECGYCNKFKLNTRIKWLATAGKINRSKHAICDDCALKIEDSGENRCFGNLCYYREQ